MKDAGHSLLCVLECVLRTTCVDDVVLGLYYLRQSLEQFNMVEEDIKESSTDSIGNNIRKNEIYRRSLAQFLSIALRYPLLC